MWGNMSISIDLGREVVDKAMEKGAREVVVRLQERLYELVMFDSGMLRSYNISRGSGIGIKVVVDGSIGYSYTSSLDRDSISIAIDRAILAAKSLNRYGVSRKLYEYRGVKGGYRVIAKVNPLDDVEPERKIDLVKKLNIESIKRSGVVSAVTRYGCEIDRRVIVSSYGSEIDIEVIAVGVSHMAVAKSGEVMERVQEQKSFIGGFEYIDYFDWIKFVEEIDNMAIKASEAKTPSPGIYTAVIDNMLIGLLLHEAFGHAAEGDGVVAEASILRGRVNERVANDLVTIVDEGVVEGGYPVPYDDEGVEKSKTIVVDNGILKHFLNSRYTAVELRQNPTGNARAQDVTFDAIVRQTNFYMLPRDASIDELFENVSNGVYLLGRGAMGGQVDPSVGTFTFSVGPSYIVRGGEVSELVRGTIVSGNILEVLKDVELVAKDVKIYTSVFGGCGKGGQMVRVGMGGPHIKVKRIIVGGV
jgi:TldD protein